MTRLVQMADYEALQRKFTAAQQEIGRLTRERDAAIEDAGESADQCVKLQGEVVEEQARAETAEAERDDFRQRYDAFSLNKLDELRAERDGLREALLQAKGEIENLLNSAPAFREGSIGAAQLTRLKVALGSARQALRGQADD